MTKIFGNYGKGTTPSYNLTRRSPSTSLRAADLIAQRAVRRAGLESAEGPWVDELMG